MKPLLRPIEPPLLLLRRALPPPVVVFAVRALSPLEVEQPSSRRVAMTRGADGGISFFPLLLQVTPSIFANCTATSLLPTTAIGVVSLSLLIATRHVLFWYHFCLCALLWCMNRCKFEIVAAVIGREKAMIMNCVRVTTMAMVVPSWRPTCCASSSSSSASTTVINTEQLCSQIDHLHAEADATRAKVTNARLRLLRLSEVAEKLQK
ncbi:hypothetical protein DEO72_LG2g4550 [Vigna unguiculata]|uniref:Uncharacterized protein n=1 Tax=Vigna unguiculata TaxID=3917 RepID=A0A4D6L6U2_VIGUN|nr:hypothetical protein DEO72_LG2g4550 [Vigna unguiculata]